MEPVTIVTASAMVSALAAVFRKLNWTVSKPAEGEAREVDIVVTDRAGRTYVIEAKEGIGEAHFASIAQVDRLATRLREHGEEVTPVLLTTQHVAPSMSKIAERVGVEIVEAHGSADEIADAVVKRLQDPHGRDLLSPALAVVPPEEGATKAPILNRIRSWLDSVQLDSIEVPQAHLASSATSLPLVSRHPVEGTHLTVEVRGGGNDFALVIKGADGRELFVLVTVETNEVRTTYILPMVDVPGRVPTAMVWCKLPHGIASTAIEADLAEIADQPEISAMVTRSVRAADGATQEAWRAIAKRAGKDSPLYAAVVEGLR